MIELHLADETATAALAAKLAVLADAGDIVALWGGLGVGKTVFARAVIRARSEATVEVPSPTFTLLQVYAGTPEWPVPVYHFDLFRISAPEEALELGIEEAFADGICLIEWPDQLGALLPSRRLDIALQRSSSADSRVATISGDDAWQRRLKEAGIA